MRGTIIGGSLGLLAAIGIILLLDTWNFWEDIGSTASFIVGAGLGGFLSGLGASLGGLIDD